MWKGLSIIWPLAFILVSACGPVIPKPDVKSDFDTALYYAKVSDAAYKSTDTIPQLLTPLGLSLAKANTLSQNDIQYFVAKHTANQTQVLAIRGTDNVRNAIVDATFLFVKVEALGINAHKGFVEVSDEILKDLLSTNGLLDKNKPVVVTGHSLGGAAAVLLAMQLKKKGYQVQAVYTYGQPKVTDRKGAELFSSLPLARYANNKDIVPLVPPLAMEPGDQWDLYWHLGKEYVLYEGSKYTELGPDASVARGLLNYYQDLIKDRNLDAHSLKNYIASLEAKKAESQAVELENP